MHTISIREPPGFHLTLSKSIFYPITQDDSDTEKNSAQYCKLLTPKAVIYISCLVLVCLFFSLCVCINYPFAQIYLYVFPSILKYIFMYIEIVLYVLFKSWDVLKRWMQPFYFTIKEKYVLFSKHKQSINIYSMLINIFEHYKQWLKLCTWYQIVMTLFVQQIFRDFKLYPR